jgi:hypothetical protein
MDGVGGRLLVSDDWIVLLVAFDAVGADVCVRRFRFRTYFIVLIVCSGEQSLETWQGIAHCIAIDRLISVLRWRMTDRVGNSP